MSQKMLTVREVAERISVSEWSIRQWVRKDLVPGATKFGNAIRIPESFITDGTAQENARAAGGPEGEEGTSATEKPGDPAADYDPRDSWPAVEVTCTPEVPEPIAPPTEED